MHNLKIDMPSQKFCLCELCYLAAKTLAADPVGPISCKVNVPGARSVICLLAGSHRHSVSVVMCCCHMIINVVHLRDLRQSKVISRFSHYFRSVQRSLKKKKKCFSCHKLLLCLSDKKKHTVWLSPPCMRACVSPVASLWSNSLCVVRQVGPHTLKADNCCEVQWAVCVAMLRYCSLSSCPALSRTELRVTAVAQSVTPVHHINL